ncbi:MAG: EAL domain-containing protein [Alphaproteobacteria bacterium]
MTIDAETNAASRRSLLPQRVMQFLPAAAVTTFITAIYLLGGLVVVDNKLSDFSFTLNPRPASGNLVLVAIDPKSIEKLEIWPWPRRFHAQVIDNLLAAGATQIAIDIDFSARSRPEEDRILQDAVRRSEGRVTLPAFSQLSRADDGSRILSESVPLPEFRQHARLASVNVRPDPDGLIRRISTRDADKPTLSAALAGSNFQNMEEFRIDYSIVPSSVPRLSYADIMEGQFDPAAVSGKMMMIGSTAVELGDQLAVPVYQTVPGPMIHILAYETLVQGRALHSLATGPMVFFIILLTFGMDALFRALSWRQSAIGAGIALCAVLGAAYAVQALAPVIVDTAAMLLAVILSFVVSVIRRSDQQAIRLVFQSLDIRRRDIMMRHVVEHSFDGIVTTAPSGIVLSVNPAAMKIFGQGETNIVGGHIGKLFPELAGSETPEQLARQLHVGEAPHELRGQRGTQSSFPAEVSASRVEQDDQTVFTAFVRDITERKQQRQTLEHQARHDALTGLPNRVMFQERISEIIAQAAQSESSFAVLLLDLDRFKEVNDTLGHHMGDRLLEQIAIRLGTVVSETDTIARFGGDEFAVILPSARNTADASDTSRRILSAVTAPFELASLTLEVGGSIGIAMYPEHGDEPESLVKCADVAMYIAKAAQTGVAVYDVEKDVNSVRYLTLSGDLRRAVAEDELVLFYQPKINLKDQRVVATEALVRWIHPVHGFIFPDDFIDKAEQTGVIRELTYWVLDKALEQLSRWHASGHTIDVAVNMSARLLNDRHIVEMVSDGLAKWNTDPASLILEVTENALMADPSTAMAVTTALSELGVRISVDDFGTGYSSLGYLKDLQADELKIDKSFVMAILEDAGNETIVRSTIGLAHALGMKVVAEGVETTEICDLLENLNCDVGQGYLFSKPLNVADFDEWLTHSEWGVNLTSQTPVGNPARDPVSVA